MFDWQLWAAFIVDQHCSIPDACSTTRGSAESLAGFESEQLAYFVLEWVAWFGLEPVAGLKWNRWYVLTGIRSELEQPVLIDRIPLCSIDVMNSDLVAYAAIHCPALAGLLFHQ